MRAIASPCRRLCAVVDGGCSGCGRTLVEVQHWVAYTDVRRAAIMTAELPRRLALRAHPGLTGEDGRRLKEADQGAVLAHLITLTADERQRCWGRPMSDAALARQVTQADWGGEGWWGQLIQGQVVALGHLAVTEDPHGWQAWVSVAPTHRRQGRATGIGRALMKLAQATTEGVAQVHGVDGRVWPHPNPPCDRRPGLAEP